MFIKLLVILSLSYRDLIIQYYPYRSINTDDIYTIISDLNDENLEVCALVFDYIKRIEPSVPIPDNTRLELDRIVNELKSLAAVSNIPVIKGCLIGSKLFKILNVVIIPNILINALNALFIDSTKLNFSGINLLFLTSIL